MITFLKELLKEPKAVRELGLLLVVFVLLFMVFTMSKDTSGAIRENSTALSANTAVVSQFQILLIDITKDKRAKSSLINSLSNAIQK